MQQIEVKVNELVRKLMKKYIDLGQPKSVVPGPGCSEPVLS